MCSESVFARGIGAQVYSLEALEKSLSLASLQLKYLQ
jgi:hypothetical protein